MNASFTKYTFKPDTTLYRTVIFLADKLVKLGFDTNKLRLSDSAQIEMLCVVVCIVGVVLERSWTIQLCLVGLVCGGSMCWMSRWGCRGE